MYRSDAKSVPIPPVKGIKRCAGKYVYYAYKTWWNSDIHSARDARKAIGKLDPEKEGYMFPNEAFYEFFPEAKELPLPSERSDTLNFGSWSVLKQTAENTGCLKVLEDYFPDQWQQILTLAVYAICEESMTAQGFEGWYFHNYTDLDSPLSTGQISRLYSRLPKNEEDILNFLAAFREAYFKNFPRHGKTVLAFDSTNQNTSSDGIEMAEYGHPKTDEGLPDINTAVFTDEYTGVPLFFETFYGSLLDKTETPVTLQKAAELGFDNIMCVCDRGYGSETCVKAFADQGIEFAISCPGNLNFVKQLIEKYGKELRDNEKYYITSENVYGMRFENQKAFGGSYALYLFYDPDRAHEQKSGYHQKVAAAQKALLEKKVFSENLVKRYGKELIIEPCEVDPTTFRNFTCRINTETSQEYMNQAGLFVVVSNSDLPAEEMIQCVRQRDKGEKTFEALKSRLGMEKTHCHNQDTFNGKMFVAFVALIIRQSYLWYLKEARVLTGSVTVATTLSEMNKIEIAKSSNNGWRLKYAMTKKQKEITNAVGFNEKSLKEKVRSIR